MARQFALLHSNLFQKSALVQIPLKLHGLSSRQFSPTWPGLPSTSLPSQQNCYMPAWGAFRQTCFSSQLHFDRDHTIISQAYNQQGERKVPPLYKKKNFCSSRKFLRMELTAVLTHLSRFWPLKNIVTLEAILPPPLHSVPCLITDL